MLSRHLAYYADIDAVVTQLAAARTAFLKVYAGFDAVRLTRLAAVARTRGLMLAGHAQAEMTLLGSGLID